jgi:cytochrome c biogenesis protein CcdA
MDENLYLQTLLMLSGVVFIIIDQLKPVLFKRLQVRYKLTPVHYEVMLHSVSVALGLVLAFAAGNDLNMFAYTDYLAFQPWIGVAASGVAIGFGDKVIEGLWNLRKAVKRFLENKNPAGAG